MTTSVRLNELAASAPIAMFFADSRGRVTYSNARCQEITGLGPIDSLGPAWTKVVAAEDRESILARWDEVIATRGELSARFRVLHASSGPRWIHLRVSAIRTARGDDAGFVGVIEDITERRARKERVESQSRILAELADGVTVMDDAGTILYANHAMQRLFGWSPEELLGRNVSMLQGDPPARRDEIIAAMRRDATRDGRWVGELASVRRDGSLFTTRASVTPFDQHGARHWITIRRDITERKRLEEAVLSLAQGRQNDVAQLLHEGVCQDLAAMSLAVRALHNGPQPSLPDIQQFLQDLELRLNDAVAATRQAADGLSGFALQRGDFELALRSLVAQFEARFPIPCDLVVEPRALEGLGVQDRYQLFHLVQQALENAGLHSDATRVRLRALRDARGLIVEVEDDGRGVGPGDVLVPRLGMAVMRHRASMIGATLEFAAIAPTGMAVTIVLGAAAMAQAAESGGLDEQQPPLESAGAAG
jgi:two-component system, LuxR family, sensor kinase FixL